MGGYLGFEPASAEGNEAWVRRVMRSSIPSAQTNSAPEAPRKPPSKETNIVLGGGRAPHFRKENMRLVCISDTHMGHQGLTLPDGDVLIHGGDATSTGTSDEVERFLDWFDSQKHPHKLLVAGNHDWLFQRHPDMADQLLSAHPGITYLQDSGIEIEGVKFWGSPWQPWFMDWAFNLPKNGTQLREIWKKIPLDTDVLITHGPPYGVLDQVNGGEHLGCEQMKIRLAIVKPRVHVFGHIHSSFGIAESAVTTSVNACTCTEEYLAINRPIVVDLTSKLVKVHGVEPSIRKQRLEALVTALDTASNGPKKKMETWVREGRLALLLAMADLREMSLEALLQDYAMRGLLSDLAKLKREEGKPSKRPVPFIRIVEE